MMIDDLLLDIPKDLREQTMEIVSDKHEIFKKFLYWQAHSIHRRDPSDFITMDRKMGMLIQIKLLLMIIIPSKTGVKEHPVVGKTIAPPEDWKTSVETFKKGKLIKKENAGA